MLNVSIVMTAENLDEILSNISKDVEQSNRLVKLISNVNELTNIVISIYQQYNESFCDAIYSPELYLCSDNDNYKSKSNKFNFCGTFLLDRFQVDYSSMEEKFYAVTENQDEEFEGSFEELKNFIIDVIR